MTGGGITGVGTSVAMQYRYSVTRDVLSGEELDSLAFDYIENEVGHYDWRDNWEKVKANPELSAKIQRWLEYLGVDLEASEIVARLDKLAHENGHARWL